jgi:hypothetical protein
VTSIGTELQTSGESEQHICRSLIGLVLVAVLPLLLFGSGAAWMVVEQKKEAVARELAKTGPVNDLVRSTTERIGANIMGKRMFDQGERTWPEDAPFHTLV